jgi:hypothetical protein
MIASHAKSKTATNRQRRESVLFPLAMLLGVDGLGQKKAEASFPSAYRKALATRDLKIQHIGHPTRYADVVALWKKDSRFITRTGYPRLLGASGKNNFATIIREVMPKSKPRDVLAVFLRYGNVRRATQGDMRL